MTDQTPPANEAADHPSVAVIVPVFDRSRTVVRTLDSVAAQTRPPGRLIVVDDGSADDLAGAFDAWRGRTQPTFRCELIRQERAGAAAARNRGLEAAGGVDLVAFLDSDDVWPADFLERTVAALAASPDAVAASVDQHVADPAVDERDLRPLADLPADPLGWLLRHDAGIGSCTLLRAEAVRAAGGYDASLPTGHDAQLFGRLAMVGPWAHAPGDPVEMGRGVGLAAGEADHLHRGLMNPQHVWSGVNERLLLCEGGIERVEPSLAAAEMERRWRRAAAVWWRRGVADLARRCEAQAGAWARAHASARSGEAPAWPEPMEHEPRAIEAAPAGARGPVVSVVIEWENAVLAEMDRARGMLRALATQIPEWIERRAASGGDGAVSEGRDPLVEVLVMFDNDEVDGRVVHRVLSEELPIDTAPARVELVEAPGMAYYAQKNLGAQRAAGDIVLFLDSDVIPQPGWLCGVLMPFEDPGVKVVGGHTYIDPDGLIGQTFALTWVYGLRAEAPSLEPKPGFWANNVAFRRDLFLRNPFPVLDDRGTARGACWRLACSLREQGETIWGSTEAQVSHPAPNGLRHYLLRGVAQGRDELLAARRDSDPRRATLRGSLARVAREQRRSIGNILRLRRRVGLSAAGAPAAAAIAATYYLLYLAGDLATRAAPNAMSRLIRI